MGDGSAAMFVVVLIFIIPSHLTILNIFDKDPEKRPKAPSFGLLTWKLIQIKVPWSMIFLLGSGFAVADGAKESGMNKMLADALKPLTELPRMQVMLIVCACASFMADFTANVTVANIILPVLADVSVKARWHPLYLMLPASIAASHSFCLPAGTPPNAIVQGPGNIPTVEYLKAGVVTSLLCLIPLFVLGPTLSVLVFKVDRFPNWALPSNHTNTTSAATL